MPSATAPSPGLGRARHTLRIRCPTVTVVAPEASRLHRLVLAPHRIGHDPTTRLGRTSFHRATLTPMGAATMALDFSGPGWTVRTWGPGGAWLEERAGDWLGPAHTAVRFGSDSHASILAAQATIGVLPVSNGHCVYHTLLPTIIAQRVTSIEAARSWRSLCMELGAAAPGPLDLRLPPDPEVLARLPYWRLHPLGVERRRADTLRVVARHAGRCFDLDDASPDRCRESLGQLPGVGPWTLGASLGHALGDPDAVAVGDFHLKNIVAFALAGRPRGTDTEMLQLLEPYSGQRGRVIRLLTAHGWSAPKFGPRQRIQPLARR